MMKNLAAVITIRVQDDTDSNELNPQIFERSFKTARMAKNYVDFIESEGYFHHWLILEELSANEIGTWDGKRL